MKDAYQLIQKITKTLFGPDDRHFQTWINQLSKKNEEFSSGVKGFMYAGVFYKPSDYPFRGRGPKVPLLDPSLHKEMEKWLEGRRATQLEKQLIQQTLSCLLHRCETDQDVRDALPDCLVEIIPPLAPLPRTRPDGYTLKDARHIQQYHKLLPKMQEYAVARFIS